MDWNIKENKSFKIVILCLIVGVFLILIGVFLNNDTKYNVSIDNNDGTTSNIVVKKGELVSNIKKPSRDGYTFLYWEVDGKKCDDNFKITKDMKLVAIWEADGVVYTITFDTDGGEKITSQTVKEGNKIIKPKNPVKVGYTFITWTLDGKPYDFNNVVNSNITLKATWEQSKKKIYKVTFNSTGGSNVSSLDVEEGSKVTKPKNPTKTGYTFVNWTLNGKEYDFNSIVTSDITLVATWKEEQKPVAPPEKKKFTVSFDSAGGSKVQNQVVVEGNKVLRPTNPTKNGYTFVNWTLNGKVYDFNTKVTGNIKLVATWKEVVKPLEKKKFTVSFDSAGGSGVQSQEVVDGDKAVKPTNPTKNGYTFVNWTLNGKEYDFNTKVTGNIKLVANWKEVVKPPEKKKFTVSFDSAGGSAVDNQIIVEGDKAVRPANPTRAGYIFVNWTLNGKEYDFNKKVTGDIKLVANWKEVVKNYTITATAIDMTSPDRILKVFEDGKQINFNEIRYMDGVVLCKGSNPTVSKSDILGETNFTVVLTDGREVNAKIVQN